MSVEALSRIEAQPVAPAALLRTNAYRRFASVFFNRPVVVFGAAVIAIVVVAAVFAPWIAPYDPSAQDLNAVLAQPNGAHLLGTDSLGRDTLSRVIFGSRIALLVGVGTVALSASIGSLLGLIAGYLGGWVNTVIMRLIDAMMAIPALLLALVVSTLLGAGVNGVLIAVAFALLPGYARLMAGQVLTV
ncbi:MAG: ABC transporter permease, partial [Chloroflexota bacterium]|nr:ABC transporter permease [Chloroflexota bacterium]